MSMTLQVINTVSLAVIAIFFLVLTVFSIIIFQKVRTALRYFRTLTEEKLEPALDNVQSISKRVQELSESTSQKIEDFTEIIPEARAKLGELIDLLDLVNTKLRSPVLSIISSIKVFSDKISKWI